MDETTKGILISFSLFVIVTNVVLEMTTLIWVHNFPFAVLLCVCVWLEVLETFIDKYT